MLDWLELDDDHGPSVGQEAGPTPPAASSSSIPGGIDQDALRDDAQVVPVGHAKRIVSLWEHLAFDQRDHAQWLGDNVAAVPACAEAEVRTQSRHRAIQVITGYREGRKTVVCQICCRDVWYDSEIWTQCNCGRALCAGCARATCPCGRCNAGDIAVDALLPRSTVQESSHISSSPLLPDRHAGVVQFGQLDETRTTEIGTEQCDPTPDIYRGAVEGTACWGCLQPLALAPWRICACGSAYCVGCAEGPCEVCGAAFVFREGLALDTEDFGGQEDGMQESADSESGASYATCRDDYPSGEAPELGVTVISPEQALLRRHRIRDAHRHLLREDRDESRTEVRQQIRMGRRPRRPRARNDGVVFLTVNGSGFGPVQEEDEFGAAFHDVHYLLIQEHKRQGEDLDSALNWLRRRGWDALGDEAYTKNTDPGGGTAIATKTASGIRPVWDFDFGVKGRLTVGISDIDGDAAVACLYGISGKGTCHQMPL